MNRASLVDWWQRLAPRERVLLGLGALVVVATAIYLLLWEPAATGIRRLRTDLPQLRVQDASMRAMADEASRLRAAGGNTAVIAPADRLAAVRRTLTRAGLLRTGSVPEPTSPATEAKAGAVVSTLSVGGAVTTVTSATPTRSDPPEVVADGTDRVRVRFENIDYGVWVSWLAATEGELAARADRVSASALAPKGPVGHVRAEVVLDWTQPAKPGRS